MKDGNQHNEETDCNEVQESCLCGLHLGVLKQKEWRRELFVIKFNVRTFDRVDRMQLEGWVLCSLRHPRPLSECLRLILPLLLIQLPDNSLGRQELMIQTVEFPSAVCKTKMECLWFLASTWSSPGCSGDNLIVKPRVEPFVSAFEIN